MPQGTVKTYDADRKGAVLLDDTLTELEVDAEAIAASGIRELRIGQRVRFDLTKDGDADRVTNLHLVSL